MTWQASASGTRDLPPETADVIVVGAGPAGSSVAHHLAQAGLEVLVLEKARLPREGVRRRANPARGQGADRDGGTHGAGRWLAADERAADGRRRRQDRAELA